MTMTKVRVLAFSAIIGLLVSGCGEPRECGAPATTTVTVGQKQPITAESILPKAEQLSNSLHSPMQILAGSPFTISGQYWITVARTSRPKVSNCEIVVSLDQRLIDLPAAQSVTIETSETDSSVSSTQKQDPTKSNYYRVKVYVTEFGSDEEAADWFDQSVRTWNNCRGTNLKLPFTGFESSYDITDVREPSADTVSAVLLTGSFPATTSTVPERVDRAMTHASKFVIDVTVNRGMPTPPSGDEVLAVVQLAKDNANG